jgi:hypothetical protein
MPTTDTLQYRVDGMHVLDRYLWHFLLVLLVQVVQYKQPTAVSSQGPWLKLIRRVECSAFAQKKNAPLCIYMDI